MLGKVLSIPMDSNRNRAQKRGRKEHWSLQVQCLLASCSAICHREREREREREIEREREKREREKRGREKQRGFRTEFFLTVFGSSFSIENGWKVSGVPRRRPPSPRETASPLPSLSSLKFLKVHQRYRSSSIIRTRFGRCQGYRAGTLCLCEKRHLP